MPTVKKYTRINFQNYPSTSTPLNATNLNKMDKGIDDLDDDLVTVKNTIENMSFDADAISYDNTQSGLQAIDVQGAVDEINDNLSGFKFYPSGTSIVGLISDDSAYTDEDGNYVVWGTETAEQLVADNPNTYKAVASEEDTRGKAGADTASPFSSIKPTVIAKWSGTKWYSTSQTQGTVNYTIPLTGNYLLVTGGNNIVGYISYIDIPTNWSVLDTGIPMGLLTASGNTNHNIVFYKKCSVNEQLSFTWHIADYNNTGGMEIALIKL